MKFKQLKNFYWVLSGLIVFGFASCKKDYNSTGFTPGTGMPTVTAVHTLSKTLTQNTVSTVITSIDNSGNVTTKTNLTTGQVVAFDSLLTAPTAGQKNNYYVIYGTNLGSATKVTFNGVDAYFNRALLTNSSLIVSVPTTAPTVGAAATNKLIITTLSGSVTYPFVLLTPLPTIVSVSTNDFQAGTQITLNGFGFATVKSIGFVGGTGTASIISQSDGTLTFQCPTTTIDSAGLVFTYVYDSSGDTKTSTSKQVFYDLDNAAFQVFTDNFGTGVSGQAWGTFGVSNTVAKTGTSSYWVNYPMGNWWIGGWNLNPAIANNFKYLSMWIKGGTQVETLDFISAAGNGGYGNSDQTFTLTVPANVWTYFKIPVNKTDMFATGQTTGNFGFYIRGPNGVSETLYFDDVVFWN